jgi:NADH:ubiquinone oxidoreductase subunit 2 (subunit N)
MTFATLVAFAAEESEHHGNVALETVGYGIVALVAFAALALVTLSYRNVANRHAHKAEAYARAHADDLPQPGHGHGH